MTKYKYAVQKSKEIKKKRRDFKKQRMQLVTKSEKRKQQSNRVEAEKLMTYTSACRYTSDPRLTKVLRLVTLFFSRLSMFLRKSALSIRSQVNPDITKVLY